MPSATDRLDFGPPHDAGSARAFMLALLVHALLIAALTWGINWKRSDRAVSFEAELWSSVPQEAAPKLVEAPPPPPPPPPPKAAEVKVAPPLPEVDIALEQEKKRRKNWPGARPPKKPKKRRPGSWKSKGWRKLRQKNSDRRCSSE